MKRIAVQGIAGSFHEDAALKYFNEEIEVVECKSFTSVCELIDTDGVDYAVMAIENTIGGTILPNYGFIEEFGLKILGEEYLRISMQLMALPGTKVSDINEVISHPMAIRQCMKYLREKPDWRISEVVDTAISAKNIKEGRTSILSMLQ